MTASRTEQALTPPPRRRRNRRTPLEQPGIAVALIRELAAGEQTQNALAAKYGVVNSAITQFKERHEFEIAEVRNRLDDQWAGLWIARKRERLYAYQQGWHRLDELADVLPEISETHEQLRHLVETADPADPVGRELIGAVRDLTAALGRESHAGIAKGQQGALRAVADELGAIPQRTQIDVTVTPGDQTAGLVLDRIEDLLDGLGLTDEQWGQARQLMATMFTTGGDT